MCLAFDFDQMVILACGFGVTLANLITHIGGVIFSKGTQVANEKSMANASGGVHAGDVLTACLHRTLATTTFVFVSTCGWVCGQRLHR
jgi:hypothetical protein